jgi:hypothetical protein
MKIAHLLSLPLILMSLHVVAEDTNLNSIHSSTQPHDSWELVRSVPNPYGGTIDFVLIPNQKSRDLTNYQAAATAIAGTRDKCMIMFWTERAYIPTSASIPVRNWQVMTATYERAPSYKIPQLQLACWLYPSKEAAEQAHCFYAPGVKIPWDNSETSTNKATKVKPKGS